MEFNKLTVLEREKWNVRSDKLCQSIPEISIKLIRMPFRAIRVRIWI